MTSLGGGYCEDSQFPLSLSPPPSLLLFTCLRRRDFRHAAVSHTCSWLPPITAPYLIHSPVDCSAGGLHLRRLVCAHPTFCYSLFAPGFKPLFPYRGVLLFLWSASCFWGFPLTHLLFSSAFLPGLLELPPPLQLDCFLLFPCLRIKSLQLLHCLIL